MPNNDKARLQEIEKLAHSLLNDIESMRCTRVPSHGGDEHWFGEFPVGHHLYDEDTFVIDWPNLSISAAKLKAALGS